MDVVCGKREMGLKQGSNETEARYIMEEQKKRQLDGIGEGLIAVAISMGKATTTPYARDLANTRAVVGQFEVR